MCQGNCRKTLLQKLRNFANSHTFAVETGRVVRPMHLWVVLSWIVPESHLADRISIYIFTIFLMKRKIMPTYSFSNRGAETSMYRCFLFPKLLMFY